MAENTSEAGQAAGEQPKEIQHPKQQKEGGTSEGRRPLTPSGEGSAFKPKKAGKNDNVVFVGKKPTMSYVLAVITQFSDGKNEVFVKARGRSISTAVDVVEVTKKKFMQGLKCEIETDTEVITDERNQRINVSTINARLFK
jgi:DNA-binding protein